MMCSLETFVWVWQMSENELPGIYACCIDSGATDCGFIKKHSLLDDDGFETQIPGDWAISSTEMHEYEAAHRRHSLTQEMK